MKHVTVVGYQVHAGQPHYNDTRAFVKTCEVDVYTYSHFQDSPIVVLRSTTITRHGPALLRVTCFTGQPYPSHTNAFVKTHKVGVCRGPYPQSFVKAWKAWDKRNKSENDPIAKHPKEQLYAVFAMADCGRDLEGYQLRGFDQARSMMLQVCYSLYNCLAMQSNTVVGFILCVVFWRGLCLC